MKEVILGIGNTLNSDDGIGVYVARRIARYLKKLKSGAAPIEGNAKEKELIPIDCGTVPENYTSVIRRHNPDRLILVDAADMGMDPGLYKIVPSERIGVLHFSTHDVPLSVFISYLKEFCGEVVLIGIQPKKVDFGMRLSSAVRRSGQCVAELIIRDSLKKIEILGI